MRAIAGFWDRRGLPEMRCEPMLRRLAHRAPAGDGPLHWDGRAAPDDLLRPGLAKAVPSLEGPFALAWFDEREQALWLGRDRLGIRPLYVARQGPAVWFASEIKAILAHPSFRADPDLRSICSFLVHTRFRSGMTPWRDLEAVEPGTLLKITRDRVEKQRWFRVADAIDLERLLRGDDPSRLEPLLEASVRLHLGDGAAVATTTSGGLDSGLVTAYARRCKPDLAAFVADVEGEGAEEGARASMVARHLGVPLTRIPFRRADFLRLWPETIWLNDEPEHMASGGPMLAVARAARAAGFSALLSGEGSDEIFGGYPWYPETWASWRRIRRRSSGAGADQRLLESGTGMLSTPHDPQLRRRLHAALDPEGFVRQAELLRKLAPMQPTEDRAHYVHVVEDMQDLLVALLQRNDRMGAAAGVEIRFPFLENAILDFALHLPRRAKLHRGKPKWVVRRAAAKVLPRGVLSLPKRCFPVPGDYSSGVEPLMEGGVVAELLGPSTPRLAGGTPRTRHALASLELWGRLFLRHESPGELGERLSGTRRGG